MADQPTKAAMRAAGQICNNTIWEPGDGLLDPIARIIDEQMGTRELVEMLGRASRELDEIAHIDENGVIKGNIQTDIPLIAEINLLLARHGAAE